MSDLHFCSLSFTLFILFTLGRKFVGSLRNVISRDARNLFIPVSNDCGGVAVAEMAGLALEHDYTVCKICRHNEVVLDDERGLLCMKNEALHDLAGNDTLLRVQEAEESL